MVRRMIDCLLRRSQVTRDGAQPGAVAMLRSQSELINRQFVDDLAVSRPAEQQTKAASAHAIGTIACDGRPS